MIDQRAERLAQLLVEYSLELGQGQLLRIGGFDASAPLMLALHRAALRAGAHPYLAVDLEGLDELLLAHGSEEQVAFVPDMRIRELERIDASVLVLGRENTRSFSRADPERQRRLLAARAPGRALVMRRVFAGELQGVATRFPTAGSAQDAAMSLAEYEDFVYRACRVLGDDPGAAWRAFGAGLGARARELEAVRELRVVGPDTDLRVGVAGRRWEVDDARHNMPGGEIFTSPVETETEGEVRFAFPALHGGREVEDVRLRFEAGRVVSAEAGRGADYLRSLLDLDDGARALGEVAFGLNYEIDRLTSDILFDEKIGGTMHVALGAGFDHLGARNSSALHWDMICDLREESEVYADGELVWRAGEFLHAPEPAHV